MSEKVVKSYNSVPKEKTPEQALNSLMRQCAKAERSSGDAKRLMYRWRIAPQDQAKILAKLVDQRFIDDRRYAEAFVREKLNLSGWGEYKIRTTLASKGVAKTIVDDVLADLDPGRMSERLREALKKKIRLVKESDPYKLRTKIIRYGISLGYQCDTVIETANELLGERDADDC